MTLDDALAQLEALGDERMRTQNTRHGAGDNQFGVRLGDIRKLAKKIKANHELAIALWGTGNVDARLLAILLLKPKSLSATEMVSSAAAHLRAAPPRKHRSVSGRERSTAPTAIGHPGRWKAW